MNIDEKAIKKYVNGTEFKNKLSKYISIKENSDIEVCFLANGEYNCNYTLILDTDDGQKKAVFRVNYGSQMKLKNQIEYEFKALEEVRQSNVTPKPYFCANASRDFQKDYLVMEFVEGEQLQYRDDYLKPAHTLAAIHSLKPAKNTHLLTSEDPVAAMIQECTDMYSVYRNSIYYNENTGTHIEYLMEICKEMAQNMNSEEQQCIINTELNSSNFLVNKEKCVLVDWEKPLIGPKEQDLGHYLAPTTTFWRSDVILEKSEMHRFIEKYISSFEKLCDKKLSDEQKNSIKTLTMKYVILNCLRGLTWSAMAWCEYNDGSKNLKNDITYRKIKEYLKPAYIKSILEKYVEQTEDE